RLAVAADLDEVHAVLYLLAHLAHHFLRRRAEHAFRRHRHAEPAREIIGEAAVGHDVAARGDDPRPREHAVGYCIARGDCGVPGAAAVADRGHAGAQYLAGVPHAAHRGPFGAAIDVRLLG